MSIAFYSGSFDPFTKGHLLVVKKASEIFDKVFVGIGVNPQKNTRRFDMEIMKKAIEETLKEENLSNVECVCFTDLTIEAAQKCNANFLIRAIRNDTDYQFEENLAKINEEIGGLDTVYFRAGEYNIVSSSMVYELFVHKKDILKYVPKPIYNAIMGDKKCLL